MLKTAYLKVTGASGTAETGFAITGEVKGLLTKMANAPAGTTDIIVRTKGPQPTTYDLYNVLNQNDSTTYVGLRVAATDKSLVAFTNSYVPYCVADILELVVAQGDADTVVEAWVFYDDGRP